VRNGDKSLCQRGLKAAWTRIETWPGKVSARGDDLHGRGVKHATYRRNATGHLQRSHPNTSPCKGHAARYLDDAPLVYFSKRAGAVMSDIFGGT
jgi:hypothetical protein